MSLTTHSISKRDRIGSVRSTCMFERVRVRRRGEKGGEGREMKIKAGR